MGDQKLCPSETLSDSSENELMGMTCSVFSETAELIEEFTLYDSMKFESEDLLRDSIAADGETDKGTDDSSRITEFSSTVLFYSYSE